MKTTYFRFDEREKQSIIYHFGNRRERRNRTLRASISAEQMISAWIELNHIFPRIHSNESENNNNRKTTKEEKKNATISAFRRSICLFSLDESTDQSFHRNGKKKKKNLFEALYCECAAVSSGAEGLCYNLNRIRGSLPPSSPSRDRVSWHSWDPFAPQPDRSCVRAPRCGKSTRKSSIDASAAFLSRCRNAHKRTYASTFSQYLSIVISSPIIEKAKRKLEMLILSAATGKCGDSSANEAKGDDKQAVRDVFRKYSLSFAPFHRSRIVRQLILRKKRLNWTQNKDRNGQNGLERVSEPRSGAQQSARVSRDGAQGENGEEKKKKTRTQHISSFDIEEKR